MLHLLSFIVVIILTLRDDDCDGMVLGQEWHVELALG